MYDVLNPKWFYGLKTYPDGVSKSGNEISLKSNTHTEITSVGGLPRYLLFKDKTVFNRKLGVFLMPQVIIIHQTIIHQTIL